MKNLSIWGIIACVVLLIAPAAVISGPAGPPEGLDVNIVNPLPIPVSTIPARQPVVIKLENFMGIGANYHVSDVYEIPEGKMLVIEQVFLNLDVAPGTDTAKGCIHTYYQCDSENVYTDFPVLLSYQEGFFKYEVSQPMKIYVYPPCSVPTEIRMDVQVNTGGDVYSETSVALISGYLEPIP